MGRSLVFRLGFVIAVAALVMLIGPEQNAAIARDVIGPANVRSPELSNTDPHQASPRSGASNGRIAYTFSGHIWTANADGTGAVQLVQGDRAAWSPDGKQIAFDGAGTTGTDIYVMNADGTGAVNITAGSGVNDLAASWSPDGSRIAFLRRIAEDGPHGIWTMNPDGTGASLVFFDADMVPGFPRWHPDGQSLVFDIQIIEVTGRDIYSIGVDGIGLTNISNTPHLPGVYQNELNPEWFPDGSNLLFQTFYTEGGPGGSLVTSIYTSLPDGSGAEQIPGTVNGSNPRISPDGTRVLYYGGFLRTVAIDGSNPVSLGIIGFSPAWQPVPSVVHSVEFTQGIQQWQTISELHASLGDGAASLATNGPAGSRAFPGANGRIVFASQVATADIATANPDGTDVIFLGPGAAPAWSPDGTKIAFMLRPSPATNRTDIWVMNADGTDRQNLTPDNFSGDDREPSWSPDGTRIAWARETENGQNLWIMNANGSGKVQITDTSQVIVESAARWSPDGSKLVFSGQIDFGVSGVDLYVVNPDGSGLTNITNTSSAVTTQQERNPDWSPDGSKIVFEGVFSSDAPVMQRLYTVNADGTGRTLLSPVRGQEPRWSPDGARILFSAFSGQWLLKTMAVDGSDVIDLGLVGNAPDWQRLASTIHSVEFTQGIQEWQTIDELLADIAGDGKPPVPMIADKVAVMRIYFNQVSEPRIYEVELTGAAGGTFTAVLNEECTPELRRRQQDGCESIDAYFIPVPGEWSVSMTVRDEGGATVQEEEFTLTSVTADRLVVNTVSLCDRNPTAAQWLCGDTAALGAHLWYLRTVMPVPSVTLQPTSHVIRDALPATPTANEARAWWDRMVPALEALFWSSGGGISLGEQRWYAGAVRPEVGVRNGLASGIPGRAMAMRTSNLVDGMENAHSTFAHELAHTMGVRHTNVPNPSPQCWRAAPDSDTDWTHPDNQIRSDGGAIEVGFDVASGKAIPGDVHMELMGYCFPRWPSPRTYNGLLAALQSPIQPQPDGPASTLPGPSWLVRGTLDGNVTFDPLHVVEAGAPGAPGSGELRIAVLDAQDDMLFERQFSAIHAGADVGPDHDEFDDVEFVTQLVPVVGGAAAIVITDDQDQEIGRLTLGGQAPVVVIDELSVAGEVVTLDWSVTDGDSADHTFRVEYSTDGQTWLLQGIDLPAPGLVVPVALLPGSGAGRFRVSASDGVNSGFAITETFLVPGKPPQATIVAPQETVFSSGQVVSLLAFAHDLEDGALDGTAVSWSSSLDGALGTGANRPVFDLSAGTHVITLTATDSNANQATDTITVTVLDYPLIEGLHLWGDNDCSGVVDGADVLVSLKALAGLAASPFCFEQGTQMPAGAGVQAWGDADCDGSVNLADALLLRRFTAGLGVVQEAGCLALGSLPGGGL